jgi:hypothetical protein
MQIASRRGVIFVNRNCILRKMTALPTLITRRKYLSIANNDLEISLRIGMLIAAC